MTAEEFAEQVAATFNTRPRRHGRELRVPCSLHEADGGVHRPSMAVWDKGGGRFAFRCLTGCSQAALKDALKARGVAVPRNGPRTTEQQLAAAKANEERRVGSLQRAKASLLAAEHIQVDDPVDAYLQSRGISIHGRNDFLTVLKAPDPEIVTTGLAGERFALLGLICDLSTLRQKPIRSTGIMTLSLNNDGTPRLVDGKKFRSIVGTQAGFGVPFGKIGPHMVVAEGLETAISALELLGGDFCVATLSASNMPNLAIPEWVRKVTIVEDNDGAGVAAAAALEKSVEEFFEVETVRYGGPDDMGTGFDANDELMRRKGLK